jgi:hypothetical protein
MRSWRGKAANFAAYFEDPFGSVGVVPAALSVSRDGLPRRQGAGRGDVRPGVGGHVVARNVLEDSGVFWKVGLVNGPSIGGDRPQDCGRLTFDAKIHREVFEDARPKR